VPFGTGASQVVEALLGALSWRTNGSLHKQQPRDIML